MAITAALPSNSPSTLYSCCHKMGQFLCNKKVAHTVGAVASFMLSAAPIWIPMPAAVTGAIWGAGMTLMTANLMALPPHAIEFPTNLRRVVLGTVIGAVSGAAIFVSPPLTRGAILLLGIVLTSQALYCPLGSWFQIKQPETPLQSVSPESIA